MKFVRICTRKRSERNEIGKQDVVHDNAGETYDSVFVELKGDVVKAIEKQILTLKSKASNKEVKQLALHIFLMKYFNIKFKVS